MRTNFLIILLALTTPGYSQNQYPFEKFPAIKFTEYENWKVYNKTDRTHFTLTLPDFFTNKDTLTIQLTSFAAQSDSSYIRIFRNKTQIQKTFEPMYFHENNVPLEAVRKLDINGDSLADLKLVIPYMGNGLASLNVRVIYLFQRGDGLFSRISYLDKFAAHMTERDFDDNGEFEILTMTLKSYQSHNYWTFNVYNFRDGEMLSQNDRVGYPIMIQYLYRKNYRITDKISADKMKTFADRLPEQYTEN